MSALLLSLILLSGHASAQDQADFAAANEKALSGDEAGAIALYESLLERGLRSEDVLYNLGTVYAQAGRWVEAAVAYERALRLAPGDAAARENLARVRRMLRGRREVTPLEQPVEVIEPWVAVVPPEGARLGFVFGASLFFLAWFLVRRSAAGWRTRLLGAMWALGLVSWVALGLVLAGQEWVRLERRAVVLREQPLLDGPDPRFREAGRVHAGARARVLEQDGPWSRIQSDEGHTGWVEDRHLAPVELGP